MVTDGYGLIGQTPQSGIFSPLLVKIIPNGIFINNLLFSKMSLFQTSSSLCQAVTALTSLKYLTKRHLLHINYSDNPI